LTDYLNGPGGKIAQRRLTRSTLRWTALPTAAIKSEEDFFCRDAIRCVSGYRVLELAAMY